MGALNPDILDAAIAQALDLIRLEAGTRQRVLAILRRLQVELSMKLTAEDLTAYNRSRLRAFLKETREVIDRYYALAQGELDLTLQGLGHAVVAHTAETFTAAVFIDAKLPPTTYLKTLASNALIQGAPVAEWWERQGVDAAFRFSTAMRQGLVQGETNQQLIWRLIGKGGANPTSGIMDIARKNAAALVQTSVQVVANEARMETFRRNADIIDAVEWLTALDGHVCILCIPRAGLRWTLDGEPIGHAVPFMVPPIHFNDRCVLIPVTKSFKALGLNMAEPKVSTRASSDGQISAKTTFDDFLQRKGQEFQNKVLGPGRAELWRNGTITLQQLLDLSGNPLTLEALRAKYA